jgi:hypothetical protein
LKPGLLGLCALALALAGVCRAQDGSSPEVIQSPVAGSGAGTQPAVASSPVEITKRFYQNLFTWQAVSATLPAATIEQLHGWPAEWGKSDAGFGKRAASLFGQFVIGNAIEDGVRAIHPQNAMYHRLGEGAFFKRFGHVAVRTVVAAKPGGGYEPAYSRLANAYGAWAIATLWSPDEYRTPGSIAKWGTAGVGAMAISNLAREFWPDLKHVFTKK